MKTPKLDMDLIVGGPKAEGDGDMSEGADACRDFFEAGADKDWDAAYAAAQRIHSLCGEGAEEEPTEEE